MGRGGGRKQVSRLPHEQVVVDPEMGRWRGAVREAQPGPCHSPHPPASSPVVEALVDLLAGQEDVGAGQDHFQAAARQPQGPVLEAPHLLRVSRNHHLHGGGGAGKASERRRDLPLAQQLDPDLLPNLLSSAHSLLKKKKRFYLFIFRHREREGERQGEKHQCVVASHTPAPSLGTRPATQTCALTGN